jgi:hypothetical protein
MTKLKFIYIIAFSSLLIGCKYFQYKRIYTLEKSQTAKIVRYDFDYKPTKTDISFLEIRSNKDSILFTYKVKEDFKDNAIFEFCKYYYNRDTILFFQGKLCPLIDTKEFTINEKKIKLKKYYYDDELSYDEETTIYFNDSIGIVNLYNDGWMSIIGAFETGYYSIKLNEKLLNDTTGFYPRKPEYPPIPKSSIKEILKVLEKEN